VKKFTFPLNRVKDFRQLQARLEEIKLEALYAELRALDTREVALIQSRVQAEKHLRAAKSLTGLELETFSSFQSASKEEQKRMDAARANCRGRIDKQVAIVTLKRRDVRLLEKLKEQRFEAWEKDMFKELDQQAEDLYLGRWGRL
jgi:DNA-binding HxlR family transcriptional regulator